MDAERYQIYCARPLAEELAEFLRGCDDIDLRVEPTEKRFAGPTEILTISALLTTIAKNALDGWISVNKHRKDNIEVKKIEPPPKSKT
jgi:hypothetical protein